MMARWLSRSQRIVYVSLLLAVLTLNSCSYFPGPPTILSLPTLRGPGLRKVSLFAPLRPTFITSLTVTTPAGQSSPLVFAAVDFYLYVGRPDGSDQHKISMASNGCSDPSFTSDVHWVVCTNYPADNTSGALANSLEIASLHDLTNPQVSSLHYVGLQDANGSYSHPSWSPDGSMLAATNENTGACAVELYDTQPPYRSFTYLMSLTDSQTDCTSSPTLEGWSPDGQYLLINGSGYGIVNGTWYLVPLSSLLTLLRHFALTTGVTPIVTLPRADVFAPFSQGVIEAVAWGPLPYELTYAVTASTTTKWSSDVRVVNILTGKERELFSISDSERAPQGIVNVGGMTWTPDGRQLIFSVEDGDPCVDCNAYRPAQLYSFTPPPSEPPRPA